MDDRDVAKRSETMAAIKSKGTSLEKKLATALSEAGIKRIKTHPSNVFGNPDLVNRKKKLAIFIDSCFWHGCPDHCRMPNSNREYWIRKIERNRKRDRKVKRALTQNGWKVIRIWEHSIKRESKLRWWITRIGNLVDQ